MIGRLHGQVVEADAEGQCLVDVAGVGYEVYVPPGHVDRLPRAPERAVLFVHTHVREDAFTLYGFLEPRDRLAFRTLLGVSGIGPRLALAIVGTLGTDGLVVAVRRGDPAALRPVPGVGRKIAERLLVELADRVEPLEAMGPAAPPSGATRGLLTTDGYRAQVARVLVSLGYRPAEAERAVARLERVEGKSLEALVREALALAG
ncbi:MAG: Holliday junction branch migration protein RuvA [Myxococcota bacterium]|nr:Holliday junction branch migration protein RuvA [Myxococcota bacterium]MDW8363396.1 Holliday junction branch migration protein RuvA [Myxococcales bacterium]